MDESLEEKKETEMRLGEALSFLVRLGQADLPRLSRGGLLDLIDGLRKYLSITGAGKIDRELRRAEAHPDALSKAAETARKVIEAVADHKKCRLKYKSGEYLIDASGARPLTLENSSLSDAVLHIAAGDIDSEKQANRIRRCPRCNAVFYGQTNAKFCSRRCASAAAVQKYRAKQKRAPREGDR